MKARATAALVVVYLLLVAASCPRDRVVYNTLGATKAAVEGAVSEFADLYRAGKVTKEDRAKVKAVYMKWAAAHDLAVSAAMASMTEDNSAVVTALQLAQEVFNLLNTYGIVRKN